MRLAAGAMVLSVASVGMAQTGLFDIDRAAPTRVFVFIEPPNFAPPTPGVPSPSHNTPNATPPTDRALPEFTGLPPMAQTLLGGVELTKAQIPDLRRSPGAEVRPKAGASILFAVDTAYTIVVSTPKGTARIAVGRGPRAEFYATRADAPERIRILKPEILGPLATAWPAYAGPWDKPPTLPEPLKPGALVEIAPVAVHPADLWLDESAARNRGLDAPRLAFKPAERELGDSKVYVRLPKAYSPRSPVGAVLWIDPGPTGQPPSIMTDIADELGLALIGTSSSGNDVNVVDRTQRLLDALATARSLVHLDPARIYASGISGGGRMSFILAGCFPDVFTGAVAMAGTSHYRDLPTPEGKVWPAYFNQPSPPRWNLLKKRRLASISGTSDFNHPHALATCQAMNRDGLTTKAWAIPGLGHALPDADQYAEALRWVDEPARLAKAERDKKGHDMALAIDVMPGPISDAQRKQLYAIMEQAPWSPAAWIAAERLGFAPVTK